MRNTVAAIKGSRRKKNLFFFSLLRKHVRNFLCLCSAAIQCYISLDAKNSNRVEIVLQIINSAHSCRVERI